MTVPGLTQQQVQGRTLNLLLFSPATLLTTLLTVSHLMRVIRSRQRPSRFWYSRVSNSILKSLMFMGYPYGQQQNLDKHEGDHRRSKLKAAADTSRDMLYMSLLMGEPQSFSSTQQPTG